MADPPRRPERDRRPHGVARHRRARGHVASAACRSTSSRTSTSPSVTIGTIYTGANVQDIEKTVTYPIEKAVSAVPDVRHVESRSRARASRRSRSGSTADADLNSGQTEVIQRIQQIMQQRSRPASSSRSSLKFDLSNIPVCLITVSGGGLDEKQLYDLAYNTIEPQIERRRRRRLRQRRRRQDPPDHRQPEPRPPVRQGRSPSLDVVRAVNDSNFLMPSGDIRIGTVDYNSSPTTSSSSSKPMEDIVVRKIGDTPVHVRDLGYVSDSARDAVERRPGQRRAGRVPAREQAARRQHHRGGGRGQGARAEAHRRAARRHASASRSTSPPTSGSRSRASGTRRSRARCSRSSSSWSSCAASSRPSSSRSRSRSRSCSRSIAMYFLGQTLNVFTLGGLALAVGPPRGRLDRRAREHQPPPHHARQGPPRGGARRRPRGRDADLRLHDHDHRRVPADGLPRGAVQAPLHPADVHDLVLALRVLPRLADGDAALCLRSCEPERPRIRRGRGAARPLHAGEPAVLRSARRGVPGRSFAGRSATARSWWSAVSSRSSSASLGLVPLIGTEFFPPSDESQFRVILRGADRDPGRGDRAGRRPDGAADPPDTLRPGELASIVSTVGIPPGRSAIFTRNTGPHAAQVQVYLDDARQADAQRRARSSRPSGRSSPASSRARLTYFNLGGIVNRVLNFGSGDPHRGGGARLRPRRRPGGRARGRARSCADVRASPTCRSAARGTIPQFERRRRPREGRHRRPLAAGGRPGRALLAELERQREPVDLHRPAHGQPVQHRRAARRAVPGAARGPRQDLRRRRPAAVPSCSSTIADIQRSVAPVEIERKYQQRLVRVSRQPGRPRPRLHLRRYRGQLRGAAAAPGLLGPAGRPDGAAARGVLQPDVHDASWRSCSSTWCMASQFRR